MKTFKQNRLLDVMYMGVILCASCSCSELELGDGLKTGKDAVPVSEIVLSDSEVYMKIGETKIVTAKVYPSDATDKTVVWSSRNEPVVKVENGKLTALKPGTAVICAESRNGEAQAFCIVRVPYENPVTGISLDKSQIEMIVGEEINLVASISPSDATVKSITWTTSDRSVATVVNGKVTAVNEGEAIITVKTDDGGKTATCLVITTKGADYIDEYGINHGYGVVIGGQCWAPVNCGYHAEDFPYGKLYQWGRKYGQGLGAPYDKGTVTMTDGGVSLIRGQHSSNADKFFIGPPDWLAKPDKTLWNIGTESSPKKSECDPCPEGWRVPVKSELAELAKNHSDFVTLTDGQKGMYFSGVYEYSEDASKIFLPASGFRYDTGGSLYNVGNYGRYWSASPYYTFDAYFLSFDDDGDAFSSGKYYRAAGCSVRCLQE